MAAQIKAAFATWGRKEFEVVLPAFLRSPVPIASLLIVLGLAAIARVVFVGRDLLAAEEVVTASAVLMLIITAPLGVAGLLGVLGGAMLLRRRRVGRILATVGIAIIILYPLAATALTLAEIGGCGPTPRDCAQRWFGVITGLGAAGIFGTLIGAVWYARLDRRGSPARARS